MSMEVNTTNTPTNTPRYLDLNVYADQGRGDEPWFDPVTKAYLAVALFGIGCVAASAYCLSSSSIPPEYTGAVAATVVDTGPSFWQNVSGTVSGTVQTVSEGVSKGVSLCVSDHPVACFTLASTATGGGLFYGAAIGKVAAVGISLIPIVGYYGFIDNPKIMSSIHQWSSPTNGTAS